MRINYITDTVDSFTGPPIGGVESILNRWICYLQERGHEVTLTNLTRLRPEGGKVKIPAPDRVDIVHAMSLFSPSIPAVLEVYKGKVPILVSPTYRDRSLYFKVNLEFAKEHHPDRVEEMQKVFDGLPDVLKSGCALADGVVTIAEGEKQDLLNAGVGQDTKFCFVPNGVDAPALTALSSGWLIKKPAQAVFYPARLEVGKNHLGLIRAFKLFALDHPEASLWLAGARFDHEYGKICEQEAQDIPLVLMGLRAPWEIYYLIRVCRVMAMPSFSEVVPLCTLEAAALGTPLAHTSASFIGEYIGGNASYFSPESQEEMVFALREAWDQAEDPGTTALRQGLAQEVLVDFSFDKCGAQLLKVYADLAGMPVPKGASVGD